MMCSLEEELDAEDSAVGQESEAVALASQVSLRCQPFRSFKARVLVCWPGKILTGIQIPRWKVCMGLRESISNPER